MNQFLRNLASPVSSFLSYSIFWLIPIWGIEASRVYLFALASKTHAKGAQGEAPSAVQADACGPM